MPTLTPPWVNGDSKAIFSVRSIGMTHYQFKYKSARDYLSNALFTPNLQCRMEWEARMVAHQVFKLNILVVNLGL